MIVATRSVREKTRVNIFPRSLFLLALNVFLLLVGTVMDIFSAIVVVVPLIIPIAASFGRRSAQGRAASSWPASRNNVASSPKRAEATCLIFDFIESPLGSGA